MAKVPGKIGFRAAVDAKCRDCAYDPLAGGTWRQQVEACTSGDCPLWPLRPKATAGGSRQNGPKRPI